jgi:large subunit ribosomal protein L1
MDQKILNAIKELRKNSKKRNFVQSFDLIINLKEYDVRKPENKINEEFALPHGRGEVKVVVFSDTIKDLDCEILTSEDVEKLAKNKRAARKFIKEVDFFLAEPSMMPLIGKHLGQLLAPRQKMPKVMSGDVKKMVEELKKSVRIVVKDAPVIQCIVGKEDMRDEEICENIESLLKYLENRLPKGKRNIKNVLLKLTMSKPVKIEV